MWDLNSPPKFRIRVLNCGCSADAIATTMIASIVAVAIHIVVIAAYFSLSTLQSFKTFLILFKIPSKSIHIKKGT